jgi:hypothetical protein
MRQHLLGGLAVADEIVVDEIQRVRRVRLGEHEVELGNDLLRRFHARLAPVKAGDVAEFAGIGAARGELHGAEQVAAERNGAVGRDREIGQRQALLGVEHHLRSGPLQALVEVPYDRVGGITQLAEMQVVVARIHFRRGRHRRAAQHGDLSGCLGAALDIVDLLDLDMHAGDQHNIGPGEIRIGGGSDVFVDEANRPALRHIGCD